MNKDTLKTKQTTIHGRRVTWQEDLSDDDVKELHRLKSELDQYWNLLRQRRAFSDAGEDPERAKLRSDDTIKNYKILIY